MIDKLTDEQIGKLAEYRDKWLKIGLDTKPANRNIFESGIVHHYKLAGLEKPFFFIWVDSPLAANYAANIMKNYAQVYAQVDAQVSDQVRDQVDDQVYAQVDAQVSDQVRDQVHDQVRAQVHDQVRNQVGAQVHAQVDDQVYAQVDAQVSDQVRDQVHDQVRAQVHDQVGAQVHDQVRNQVGAQVHDQVRNQVGAQVHAQVYAQVYAQVDAQVSDQVRDQVHDQVRAQVHDQVGAQVHDQVRNQVDAQVDAQVSDQVRDQVDAQKLEYFENYFWGKCGAGWFSYFDFMIEILKVEIKNEVLKNHLIDRQICENGFWWYAFKNLVICVEPPKTIKFLGKRLHCENGPAIEFRDGFSVWCLNGVRVTKEIVETPPEKIPMYKYFEEKNIEIRREIYRKIGAERFLKNSSAKLINTWKPSKKEIELLNSDLDENVYYLYELDLGFKKAKYLKMELRDKQGLVSYYLECCINQDTNSAKEAFYADRPWLSKKEKILLS